MTESAPSSIWRWVPLVVLCLALMISAIDTTLLNVSVSAIITDLKTTLTEVQWVIAAYSLTLAALTVTGGRLGDLYGRKKMFVLGAIIFGIGSLIASYSRTVPTLIWGESIVEGIGAALMLPATSSLIVANYQGRDRAIAFGAWGMVAAIAVAVGPVLGGFLTTHYSWRWGFRINPIVALILVLGSVVVHDGHLAAKRPKLDWLGIVLSGVGLFFLLFGIIEAENYGWWIAKQSFIFYGHALNFGGLSITVPSIIIGLFVVGLFLLYESWLESRGAMPLVSPHLFENKQFSSGALTYGLFALGQVGLTFTIAVFLESVQGIDALHTGVIYIPLAVGLVIFSPLSAFISQVVPPKRLVQIGIVVNIIAMFIIRSQMSVTTTVNDLVPAMFLLGCGYGCLVSQLTNITLSAVRIEESGEASGINNTSRLIGQSIGAAVVGAVLVSVTATHFIQTVNQTNIIAEEDKGALITSVNKQSAELEFSLPKLTFLTSQDSLTQLDNLRKQAVVDGNKTVLLDMIGFAALAFVSASLLTNKKRLDKPDSKPSGH